MRRIALTLAAVAAAGFLCLAGRAAPPKDTDELMRRKLQHSQKVLEGVALADFDKIAKHAEELTLISKRASFRVYKTPLYELYSNEFRATAEELIKHAEKENLDAAALSYVELTLTCVKCHKHVREKRMARLD
jgi:hypothetical protein